MAADVSDIINAYIRPKPNNWPSARKYRHLLNAWIKRVGDQPPTAANVTAFRNACRTAGQSAATYEGQLKDLRTACRASRISLNIGHSDAIPTPDPSPAELDIISAAHRESPAWMRVWIPLAYWTGLRLRDSLDLLRTIDPAAPHLTWTAHKTRRNHSWPIPPWLRRHLAMPIIIPPGKSTDHLQRVVRRELRAACESAGTSTITPQQIRQRGITEWTAASLAAGSIVHGCGLTGQQRIMRHYAGTLTILERAAPAVRIPDAFATPDELAAANGLPAIIKRLDPEAQQILLSTAKRLSTA